jgi:glutamine synthetase
MNSNTPNVDLAQEINAFINQHPRIEMVELICLNLSGQFFGKRYPIKHLEKLSQNTINLPRSIVLINAKGEAMEVGQYGYGDGDPDQVFMLVPGTLTYVSWNKTPLAQMLVSTVETQTPLFFEPRAVLARILDKFRALGYYPKVAFELEFYLLDRERLSEGQIQPPINPQTSKRENAALLSLDRLAGFDDYLNNILKSCELQGIKTGALTAEMGAGQYEINLEHFSDAMQAADQCALFGRCVRNVARQHGYQATFMAKPYLDQPGSGQHLHISLYDKQCNNILQLNSDLKLTQAVAGCLKLLPESMAFMAPNINAYRRIEKDNCVPLSPNWGYDNRTTAIRIPKSKQQDRRIEHRVAGADSNPYLLLASILAGIAYGLENQLSPPAPEQGNVSEARDLPTTLPQALAQLERSQSMKHYLGEEFVDIYRIQKQLELAKFERYITSHEYSWYL